jgi:UDP-N-acetylmuramate--alanine ligase
VFGQPIQQEGLGLLGLLLRDQEAREPTGDAGGASELIHQLAALDVGVVTGTLQEALQDDGVVMGLGFVDSNQRHDEIVPSVLGPVHPIRSNGSVIPERTTSGGIDSGQAARLPVPGLPIRIHLLGAGGAGVSGAAQLLRSRGHQLSGHDRAESPFLERLRDLRIPLDIEPSATHLLPEDAEAIVRSAAVPDDDPQVLAALERGLPVLRYGELLGKLGQANRTLGIAGTHGKTTSSWMALHCALGVQKARSLAGLEAPRPGALVGGLHTQLETNAVSPEGDGWFIAEACEYDRTFLQLSPEGAIITNLEPDHLDYYGSEGALIEAFARYADSVHPEGLLVLGRDVPGSVDVAARCDTWRLGREFDVDLCSEDHGRFEMRVRGPGWATPAFRLSVPGQFNVDNAACAIALIVGLEAMRGEVDLHEAATHAVRGLALFHGAARRFETWGHHEGIDLVHDYAHHPTEVGVTLEAARRVFPGRPIHVLFQPHQHSRTARFMEDFVEVLRGADRVVISEVYGARRVIDRHVAGAEELVMRLRRAGVDAAEGGDLDASVDVFVDGLPMDATKTNSVGAAALIMGAGDIDGIRGQLTERLALRGPARR